MCSKILRDFVCIAKESGAIQNRANARMPEQISVAPFTKAHHGDLETLINNLSRIYTAW